MKDLQEYIEQNLPDRFKNLKVFRIPVTYNGKYIWACFKNGLWEFKETEDNITPLLEINCEHTDLSKDFEGDVLAEYPIEENSNEVVKEYSVPPFSAKYRNKKRKSMALRIIVCLLSILFANFISGFLGGIYAIKANNYRDDEVNYWHYRRMSTFHATISYILVILLLISIASIAVMTMLGLISINSLFV